MLKRILIIDTDVTSSKIISTLLNRTGNYSTDLAYTAGTGIAKAVSSQPDLIILDVMLPDMSGWESCKVLREMPETHRIPIIIFSKHGAIEDVIAGFKAGTYDYLVKPTPFKDLLERIENVLNGPEFLPKDSKSETKEISPFSDIPDNELIQYSSKTHVETVENNSYKIFISYRRSDTEEITSRIYDSLVLKFGTTSVFRDIQSIPYGVDFRTYLDENLRKCHVLLAIIGQKWLSANNDDKSIRRIDEAEDYVRLEIETALQRGIHVIPVLVQQTKMPKPEELPISIKDLAFRNAANVKPDPDFHSDMQRLNKILEKLID